MASPSSLVCTAAPGVSADCMRKADRFVNDDACGDWVFPLGSTGLEFQAVNAASASCYIVAGGLLIRNADSPLGKAYGFLMCWVGVGSFSFHATTSLTGFFIDIVPMAAIAAMMVYRAVHALQADAGQVGPEAETRRLLICLAPACVAVYVPWAMLVAGMSHEAVWGVWALLFGSMGAAFGVVALAVFWSEGLLWGQPGVDLAVAVVSVLLGLGFSIHSFIPGLCEGWRTAVPLHAFWHLFSAVSSYQCGRLLNRLSEVVVAMEAAPVVAHKKKQREKGNSLLVRMLKHDILPSQFSM